LIFGLTNHGPMLPERSPWCQYAVFGGLGRLRFALKRVRNGLVLGFDNSRIPHHCRSKKSRLIRTGAMQRGSSAFSRQPK
jgi:hypothetical protein